MIRVMRIVPDTTVDGIGWRTTIYCAGCAHHCHGCHNQETWDFSAGTEYSVPSLLDEVLSYEGNITFSGGDPMYQAEDFAELARLITERGRTVWCYTGFTFEEVLADSRMKQMLPYLEVLVDGQYVESLASDGLLFRGSSNQRLIDVQQSLKEGRVVLWDYDPYPKFI